MTGQGAVGNRATVRGGQPEAGGARAVVRRHGSLLLVVAASLLWLWGAAHSLEQRNDDSYITLTFVKSLVAGQGWRYNGGAEVLGTTTPLFALTIAGLARLLPGQPLPHLAVAWSALCWLGAGWLLALRAHDFGLTRAAGALVAAALLAQGGWWYLSLGMEATMLLAGVLLASWLAARQQALACGVVSALLCLVRPEGLAMVPLAALWLLWRGGAQRGRLARHFALGAALPLALWAAYAWPRFGSVLPASASAKLGQGAGWAGGGFAARVAQEWLPPLLRRYGLSPLLSLLWPLAALGLWRLARQRGVLLLPLAWVALFVTAYTLLHAPGYWWYQFPLLFALHALAALGLAELLARRQPALRALGLAALLFYGAITAQVALTTAAQGQGDVRAVTYQAVAAWLGSHSQPTQSVAYIEIGYLGFYSDNRIVDLVGLVQPEFAANAARRDLASSFWQATPDFFLYHPAADWLLGPIVQDARFAARYRPVASFVGHLDQPHLLYARVASAP